MCKFLIKRRKKKMKLLRVIFAQNVVLDYFNLKLNKKIIEQRKASNLLKRFFKIKGPCI